MAKREYFFDEETNTVTAVVWKESVGCIIDSVLNFDMSSGTVKTILAEKVAQFCKEKKIQIEYILDTHIHADHLTASFYLKEKHFPSAKIAIGENVQVVQKTFSTLLELPSDFCGKNDFDVLLRDDQVFSIGSMNVRVLNTPGHTPACCCYHFVDEKFIFVGDTIFMEDSGSARCDFPGGSSSILYDSITRLLSLPDETTLIVGHDYKPGRSEYRWETTIAKEKAENPHVVNKESGKRLTKEEFMKIRDTRDKTLSVPRLLYPSLQVNLRGGRLPPFFKVPLKYASSL